MVELTAEKCVEYAMAALNKRDYLACVHNLNDGMAISKTKEQKAALHDVFVMVFEEMGSYDNIRDVLARDFCIQTEGSAEFLKIDMDTFIPFDRDDDIEDFDEEIRIKNIYNYSRFRSLCIEKKYEEALEIAENFPDTPHAFKIYLEAMINADMTDPKFNINDFLLSGIGSALSDISSESYFKMTALMLRSGGQVRRFVVEAADFVLENASCLPDIVYMGKHFFLAGEYECAEKFFLKALEFSPVEANSLYYLTIINKLNKNDSQADGFWGTYKTAFKVFDAPINLMEKYFDSKSIINPVPYRMLPESFQKDELAAIQEKISEESALSDSVEREAGDYFKLASEYYALKLFLIIVEGNKVSEEFLLGLLKHPWIPDGIKFAALSELLRTGYEGQMQLVTPDFFKTFVATKCGGRMTKNWKEIYMNFVRVLAFSEKHVPIKCNVIAKIIKKIYGILNNYIKHDMVSNDAALIVAWLYYIKELDINIRELDLAGQFTMSKDAIEEGFMIYKTVEEFFETNK